MTHPWIVAIVLLQFTGPTGGRVDINRDAISSVRNPANAKEGHFAPNTGCVLVMTNGHLVTVRENCDDVRRMIADRSGPCALVCGESPKR